MADSTMFAPPASQGQSGARRLIDEAERQRNAGRVDQAISLLRDRIRNLGASRPLRQRLSDLLLEGGDTLGSISDKLILAQELANDGRLRLCPASGGSCRTLSRAGSMPRWTQGGREIYFIRYPGATETMPLFSVRPDGTGERQVAELSGFHPLHFGFDAAPGGEIVWTEWRPGQQQLWQAELPSN